MANVSQGERAASVALGGALLLYGLSRRSLGGVALAVVAGDLLYRGISGRSPLYQALGMSTASPAMPSRREATLFARAPETARAMTIAKSADDLYRLWHEPQVLSRIMGHFAEVTATGAGRTHWVARAPRGQRLEWDAQVVEDRPGELIHWKSVGDTRIPNEGTVRFRPAPGNRGTEVILRFRFHPPGGALGETAARLLRIVPSMLAEKALRRFKSLVETGEIPTTAHQPAARRGGRDQ
jgi:uncharacterized membrane protein